MKGRQFLIVWLLMAAAFMMLSSRQQEAAQQAAAGSQAERPPTLPTTPPQRIELPGGLPVFYDDLVLDSPDWRERDPRDLREDLRRRLENLPKPMSAPERDELDRQAARLHLTIAWVEDAFMPEDKLEAAREYALQSKYLGRYRYAGQAKLRASEIYLELAKQRAGPNAPAGDPRLAKEARRVLDTLAMGILRAQQGHDKKLEPVRLWERRGDRWVECEDPYGYALQRIDAITHEQLVYRLIDLLVAVTGRIPGWSEAIALFLLAIGLKLAMYPLSRKTYQSMAATQKLQPVIEELRKRHKDNPQKLNEEMMRVYREHGVNPLAGCLPMLVQIPVFIFVYQGIRAYTYHFHHVPLLWIRSLAQPDVALLLIYGVSMYVSQKITMAFQPPPADPQQAQTQRMMAVMMPVMFTYMMYMWGLPSAFYLYWLAFNVLSTAEQMITHRRKREVAPPPAEAEGAGQAVAKRDGSRGSGGKSRRRKSRR